MNDYSSRSNSYYGHSYNIDRDNSSTFNKVQQQYWVTKQTFLKKLGRKEDDCIVASDSELDAKLELFRSIEHTSLTLQKVIEMYQDKLLALSQEENCMGRFLKEHGKIDKTRAGKMMMAAGKSLSYTAQQRLSLRVPLVRLYQEVETFRYRAIADTLVNVQQMENSRTEYRAALLWMKDISQELDPDTYKQLDKFRKVQTQVRRTKTKFDKQKLDCLQKIDLLAASRCNMFSHALALYQNTLLTFWKKTSRTMSAVAESFKGYQHYEFSMLKELTEPSKKLAEETSGALKEGQENEEEDKDRLIFFEEYHDTDDEEKSNKNKSQSDSMENLFQALQKKPDTDDAKTTSSVDEQTSPLLDLIFDEKSDNKKVDNSSESQTSADVDTVSIDLGVSKGPVDLLTNNPEIRDEDKDDLQLLNEILSMPTGKPETTANGDWQSSFTANSISSAADGFTADWNSAFGNTSSLGDANNSSANQEFLPSQLWDLNLNMASLNLPSKADQSTGPSPNPSPSKTSAASPSGPPSQASTAKTKPSKSSKKNKPKDMSAWFDLFADLDPLANPDAIGKKAGDLAEDDRNC